jgi:hypothetical protein
MTNPSAVNLTVSNKLFIGSWGSVTQDTSITTGVTINTARGQIITFDPALAAAGEVEFVVTNSECHADSVVILSVALGPSDNEHVFAFVSTVAEGSFSIVLSNLAAANQADGAVSINFLII